MRHSEKTLTVFRMVFNFIPKGTLFGVKAYRFGLYFVLLDIV